MLQAWTLEGTGNSNSNISLLRKENREFDLFAINFPASFKAIFSPFISDE
jgi:hypothetical protein